MKICVIRYSEVPGLPGQCFVLSNSERRKAHCPRRYLLSVIEGLKPEKTSPAARFGQLFHLLKESVHEAWLDGRGPTADEMQAALDDVWGRVDKDHADGRITVDEADDMKQRLTTSFRAWAHVTDGAKPPEGMKLVAYENALCMPINGPTGNVYRPDMYIVESEPGVWRIARSGELRKSRKVNWPWYFIGRLDMLFATLDHPGLWVADDKTSAQPTSLISRLGRDPQVLSYLALVRYNAKRGVFGPDYRDAVVHGFWHRVTRSSGYNQPKLKRSRRAASKGAVVGLSLDKRQRCLSWEYREMLERLGFDPGAPEYAEMIAHLKENVDKRVELNEYQSRSDGEIDRFLREVYSDARRISGLWRSAQRAKTYNELDLTHPRVPVCQSGGFCSFIGPCEQDGEIARRVFSQKPWVTWS